MINKYDFIIMEGTLPIKATVRRFDEIDLHWHNEYEFIFVLEGSIEVCIEKDVYYLKESDVMLVNGCEFHSIKKIEDQNLVLILKVAPDFYDDCFPIFKNLKFECKSFNNDSYDEEKFEIIRNYISNIAWNITQKNKGYELTVGSYLYLLGDHLINNFKYEIVDTKKHNHDRDVTRINNIINYINDNLFRNITLKEIAEKYHLNYHFLSHFIKDKIGMSFQEYLNKIRLDKAEYLLTNSNSNISDIAISTGFSSTSYFNKLFKKKFNCSPSEYRELLEQNYKSNTHKIYYDINNDLVYEKLFTYLSIPSNSNMKNSVSNIEHVYIDSNSGGKKLIHYWKKLSTFGRASVGLRNNFKKQLSEFQREINFEYIRVSGLFMEDMMIYSFSDNGKISYNWSEVDKILDMFVKVKVKPFIEMDFIYESKNFDNDNKDYLWKVNMSPLININLWTEVILEFMKHCIDRYGFEEVVSWCFEVWNYPDYKHFQSNGRGDEYLEYYKNSIKIIKSISKRCKVGGPTINHGSIIEHKCLLDIVEFCKKNNIDLDFLSVNIHTAYVELKEVEENILYNKNRKDKHEIESQIKKIYYDKNCTIKTLQLVKSELSDILNSNFEIHVIEWNTSSQQEHLKHDASYVATFIIKNYLQSIRTSKFIDNNILPKLYEAKNLRISSIHGGFGLLNNYGLKKTCYFAYYLLSKLGDTIIDQSDDYIVTKREESIQILAYNYAYFDDLFMQGDMEELNNNEKYYINNNEKSLREIEYKISDLYGKYKFTTYKLNREYGSVFEKWTDLGSPENMTQEELRYLKGNIQPKIEIQERDLTGEYTKRMSIPVHGAELLIIDKRY
nr:helix-turn-helix domain-containing protein [Clostridioides sp.]